MMLQLKETADGVVAEPSFTLMKDQFDSEQHTPVYYHGHLFAVRKSRGGQLVCMDLEGKEIWNGGRQRLGHGPHMIADGMIFVLSGDGVLRTAEATPEEYRPLAEFQVFEDGHDAWGPMAKVAGRLIVRDMTRMACLGVRVKD